MVRGIVGVLALALACVAAPARADSTYGSVSGINGVLYDDCRDYPYRYAVAPPADAQDWDVDVTLYGPDGRLSDTDFISTLALSGTSTFFLCPPSDRYGGYTIRATFEWLDADSQWQHAQLDDAHFSMRKPRTRTALSVSTRRPAYGQVVRYRIRVWDERPSGYHPTAFAWVVLQRKVDGHWVRIRGSRTLTHDNGRVKVPLKYLRHHRRMKIRAAAQESARWSRSTSDPVRLW
jgi:hypothetical protein